MKRKLILVTIMSVLALQMAACGEEPVPTDTGITDVPDAKETAETAEDTENTEAAGIANPWVEITEDLAYQLVPNGFSAPEGATNVVWRAMGNTDPGAYEVPGPLVEMDFDLEELDMSFVAREQMLGDDYQDISGMYYNWTVTDDVKFSNWGGGNMPGKMYRYIGDNEYVDLITWYDIETGAAYSLSTVAKDLDGFDIQAVAESIYDPKKQVGANMPDDEDIHQPMDITGCETFTQIVDKLKAGQGYANITVGDRDVLLVSSGTYDYDGDGKKFVAIDADVFEYDADGNIRYTGYVEAGGTAYPLASDGKILYVGSNHGMKKMIITDFDILAVDENAYVEYDTDGKETYYHTSELRTVNDDPEGKVKDDSIFGQFFEDYGTANIIEFNTIQ